MKIEQLIVRLAKENRDWSYDRLVGALSNLGHRVTDQTVGNVLARHGIPPAPERGKTGGWLEYIRAHKAVLSATDCFTVEVLEPWGLITYYVLFTIHSERRRVTRAGVTQHSNDHWMQQFARNITMEEWGCLNGSRYLLPDGDTKFIEAFPGDHSCERSGTVTIIPPASPDLNAYAERWIQSIKYECLSQLILLGEASLRRSLRANLEHYHTERNHQGKGNVLLFPNLKVSPRAKQKIHCSECLGRLLMYYEAA